MARNDDNTGTLARANAQAVGEGGGGRGEDG